MIGFGLHATFQKTIGKIIDCLKRHAPKEAFNISKLGRGKCVLKRDGLENKHMVIIDLDQIGRPEDSLNAGFLIGLDSDGGWLLPVEVKGGAPDVKHCAKQLQSAAKIAEEWSFGTTVENFQAVIVSRNMPKSEFNELEKSSNQVRFNNQYHPIMRLECGYHLSKALK